MRTTDNGRIWIRRALLLLLIATAVPLAGANAASAAQRTDPAGCNAASPCTSTPRDLGCKDTASCGVLKKLCIKAAGTYTETTFPTGGVSGTCKLPKPEPRAWIGCTGAEDCGFLKGWCIASAGEYADLSGAEEVSGICFLPNRSKS